MLAAVSTVLVAIFAVLCLPKDTGGGSNSDYGSLSNDDLGGEASFALYAVAIVLNLCQGACFPIFYEMGVEAAFPIAEGLSTQSVHCEVAISKALLCCFDKLSIKILIL